LPLNIPISVTIIRRIFRFKNGSDSYKRLFNASIVIVSRLRLKCTRLALLRTCSLSRDTACIVNPTWPSVATTYATARLTTLFTPVLTCPALTCFCEQTAKSFFPEKTVYPYLKLPDDLAVIDAMLNEGGDYVYNPVALDGNMFVAAAA